MLWFLGRIGFSFDKVEFHVCKLFHNTNLTALSLQVWQPPTFPPFTHHSQILFFGQNLSLYSPKNQHVLMSPKSHCHQIFCHRQTTNGSFPINRPFTVESLCHASMPVNWPNIQHQTKIWLFLTKISFNSDQNYPYVKTSLKTLFLKIQGNLPHSFLSTTSAFCPTKIDVLWFSWHGKMHLHESPLSDTKIQEYRKA